MTNPEQRWHKCFGTIDGQKRTWKRQCESDTTSGDGKQPPPVGCYGNICDAPLSEWKRQQHTHYQLTSAAANRRQESKELRKRERERVPRKSIFRQPNLQDKTRKSGPTNNANAPKLKQNHLPPFSIYNNKNDKRFVTPEITAGSLCHSISSTALTSTCYRFFFVVFI